MEINSNLRITPTYLSFHMSMIGKHIVYKGRYICKSAAYWGIRSGSIKISEIGIGDKPGWINGEMINHPEYVLWLMGVKY